MQKVCLGFIAQHIWHLSIRKHQAIVYSGGLCSFLIVILHVPVTWIFKQGSRRLGIKSILALEIWKADTCNILHTASPHSALNIGLCKHPNFMLALWQGLFSVRCPGLWLFIYYYLLSLVGIKEKKILRMLKGRIACNGNSYFSQATQRTF